MPSKNLYDLLIIGAGPAGLACAIEARKAGLRYCVLDKGGVADSIQRFQRDMFFFSTPELLEIGSIPFVVPTTRPTSLDCVNYYRAVVQHYDLSCILYEHVTACTKSGDRFTVHTAKGTRYDTRYLAIATGYYDTPTPLNVPGENLPHVSHYYRDPMPFFAQDVLIVGGKNSAVEAALDLWRHGARVTVVHRGDTLSSGIKYWILPDFENRVNSGSISLRLGTRVTQFKERTVSVERSGGARDEIVANFVFVLIGYRPDGSFLRSFGINVSDESLAPEFNPETMETNVPGIFVAGGLVGGKFNNKVFIENGREHSKKIIPAITERP